MSVYNGKSKRIKNALKTLIEGIQYDAGSGPEAAFTQVLDNNRLVFEGYPNAQILPGDVTNDRQTTNQSERTPAYIVRVRIPLEDTDDEQSAAYDKMYDLTDLVMDTIDAADEDDELHAIDPTLGVIRLTMERGDWVVEPSNAGSVLLCDLNISVSYSKNYH